MMFFVELNDKRNNYIFNKLQSLGYIVFEYKAEGEKQTASGSVSYIFAPARKLSVADTRLFESGSTVYGGEQTEVILAELDSLKIKYVNILKSEKLTVQNAVLTAEGTLALLIENTEKSIYDIKTLILGGGRVGKAVAALLTRLGVDTAIANRSDLNYAAAYFFCKTALHFEELNEKIGEYDVIINTVPTEILGEQLLAKVKPDALIMELASAPCLNKLSLPKFTFKYLSAQSLPGKFSPISAGEIILSEILSNIK